MAAAAVCECVGEKEMDRPINSLNTRRRRKKAKAAKQCIKLIQ
jgi:hypothetical protein